MSSATKRPRAEMEQIAACFLERIRPHCERVEIAGSLRRGVSQVGDVEVVAIPRLSKRVQVQEKPGDLFAAASRVETVEQVNDLWTKCDELADTDSFTKHGDLYRQFVFAGAVVDVFLADRDNWGNILLIRTGSWEFSKWMMGELLRRGHRSVDGRIYRHDGRMRDPRPVGPAIPTPEEIDIFRAAGHVYIEPRNREIAPGVRRTS